MITAVIKKKLEDARMLAMKHGIDNFTIDHVNNNEIYISLDDTLDNRVSMMSWFCDPDTGRQPPFASGSCLYYQWENES